MMSDWKPNNLFFYGYYSVCVCVSFTLYVWNSGALWCSRRRGPEGGTRPWKLRRYSVSMETGFFLKAGTDLLLEYKTCKMRSEINKQPLRDSKDLGSHSCG
ncbi:hypothetical protein ILYODFUR_027057 [Ilyodon furcidens]|uniref:Uncharacterized protein n=1 Tax=Ilyodon furcidens TaxID=33524 RepID=A0ABV0TFD1_9TELE